MMLLYARLAASAEAQLSSHQARETASKTDGTAPAEPEGSSAAVGQSSGSRDGGLELRQRGEGATGMDLVGIRVSGDQDAEARMGQGGRGVADEGEGEGRLEEEGQERAGRRGTGSMRDASAAEGAATLLSAKSREESMVSPVSDTFLAERLGGGNEGRPRARGMSEGAVVAEMAVRGRERVAGGEDEKERQGERGKMEGEENTSKKDVRGAEHAIAHGGERCGWKEGTGGKRGDGADDIREGGLLGEREDDEDPLLSFLSRAAPAVLLDIEEKNAGGREGGAGEWDVDVVEVVDEGEGEGLAGMLAALAREIAPAVAALEGREGKGAEEGEGEWSGRDEDSGFGDDPGEEAVRNWAIGETCAASAERRLRRDMNEASRR